MAEWNYDLTACPMHEEVLLLWAYRELEGDEDMPTGKISAWVRVLGERMHEDVTDNHSWQSGELDQQPNAEFWGDDEEAAMTPTAWCALLPVPPIPEETTQPIYSATERAATVSGQGETKP